MLACQPTAYTGDDCYNFYTKCQEPKEHAPLLDGDALTKIFVPNENKRSLK